MKGYISRKCNKCKHADGKTDLTPEPCDQCRYFWPSCFIPKEAEQRP